MLEANNDPDNSKPSTRRNNTNYANKYLENRESARTRARTSDVYENNNNHNHNNLDHSPINSDSDFSDSISQNSEVLIVGDNQIEGQGFTNMPISIAEGLNIGRLPGQQCREGLDQIRNWGLGGVFGDCYKIFMNFF